MAGKAAKIETIPNPSTEGSKPSKVGRISANAAQVAALEARKAEARALAAAQLAERRAEAVDNVRHLEAVAARELERGEAVEVGKPGERVVLLSRDGLEWMKRKGDLGETHYRAGLRFRADYELANGTGVPSCLAAEGMGGGAFGPRNGAAQAQIVARGAVEAALKALGTPMLVPYVVGVAGEGRTLAEAAGVEVKRADEHKLPCRIAFDLLARHYGMLSRA